MSLRSLNASESTILITYLIPCVQGQHQSEGILLIISLIPIKKDTVFISQVQGSCCLDIWEYLRDMSKVMLLITWIFRVQPNRMILTVMISIKVITHWEKRL